MTEGLSEIKGGSKWAMGCIEEENLNNRAHDEATASDASRKRNNSFTYVPLLYFMFLLALSFLQSPRCLVDRDCGWKVSLSVQ